MSDFRPASPENLAMLEGLGVPPGVREFYGSHEPVECAQINGIRLWPIAEILRENREFVPGVFISRFGYVVFATTDFGDAFCIDTQGSPDAANPRIVLLPHDVFSQSSDKASILRHVKIVARDFREFLTSVSTGSVDLEPYYP